MKRTLAFVLSLLFVFSSATLFSSCDGGTIPEVTDKTSADATLPVTDPITDPVTDPATEPVTDAPTTTVTEPATEPVTEPVVVDPVPVICNPLTGLPTETDLSAFRPVAISIDNVLAASLP